MGSNETSITPGGASHTTTARREWLGWFGVMFWLYSMINGYQYLPNGYNSEYYLLQDVNYIWWFIVAFLTIGIISIIAVSFRFGRNPDGLGRLASYATPVAVVFTALFPFLPPHFNSILYALSPAFIAPVLVRRAYGIAHTARPVYVITTYMSGIAVAFALMNPFLDYCCDNELTAVIPYTAYAASALLAWFGVRRRIGIKSNASEAAKFRPSKSFMAIVTASVLLMFWLTKISASVYYTVEYFDDLLYIPVYIILPPLCYLLFGFIGDKGRERIGIISALALFLISIQLVFITGNPESATAIPLVFTNHIFGIYIEYFVLAIPVYFFTQAKRPVLAASFGVALYLLDWLFCRLIHPLMPDSLMQAGAPMFVSIAIPAIALLILLHFIFERYHEKTLAAALYAMFRSDDTGAETDTPEISQEQKMFDAGFTPEEIKVAILLIEGETAGNINKKLHAKAADTKQKVRSIRTKLTGLDDPDPVRTAIVSKYNLTKTEADLLPYIRSGMTNAQIAAELNRAEDTIKVHMRHIKQKLPVGSKQEIAEWLADFEKGMV